MPKQKYKTEKERKQANTNAQKLWRAKHKNDPKLLAQKRKDARIYNQRHPERKMYDAAKYRAARKGLDFNLDPKDISIPDICPLLGIKLRRGSGKSIDSSPTLDRIDSSKGYIKGNVWVVSKRANCIKNDATPDELIHIAMILLRNNGSEG